LGRYVQQATEDNGYTLLLLIIGDDPRDLLLVLTKGSIDATEKDFVRVYGRIAGSQEYESIAKYDMSVPYIEADAVKKIG
jgi:hypothetical protein